MNLGFQQPTSTEWEKWRPQFEQQFNLLLQRMGAIIEMNGELTVFRLKSKYNPQTYIELGTDGKIKRVSNGVDIDNV